MIELHARARHFSPLISHRRSITPTPVIIERNTIKKNRSYRGMRRERERGRHTHTHTWGMRVQGAKIESTEMHKRVVSSSIRRNLEESQRQRKCEDDARNEARKEGWCASERETNTEREEERERRGDEGAMETVGAARAGRGARGAVERQGRTRGWSWAPDDLKRSCD